MGLSLEKDSIFSGIKFFYDDLLKSIEQLQKKTNRSS